MVSGREARRDGHPESPACLVRDVDSRGARQEFKSNASPVRLFFFLLSLSTFTSSLVVLPRMPNY